MAATTPSDLDTLILPTPLEGSWQTSTEGIESITIGDHTATLTPEGKGAKRNYSLARRGKQIETGTFTRTPRKAMNKLLHQRHFAALSTTLLRDWRAALKSVLREREEARWTDTYGVTWRRWQAVLGSLEHRSPAGKSLDEFAITGPADERMLRIVIRSGEPADNQSQRKWTVTGWAPLLQDTQHPKKLAPVAFTKIDIRTTNSDGTDNYHYTFQADSDWGGIFARTLTRTAAQLSLYQLTADKAENY